MVVKHTFMYDVYEKGRISSSAELHKNLVLIIRRESLHLCINAFLAIVMNAEFAIWSLAAL